MWTSSALFFEYAGRNIKAMNLNLIRLIFAFILLGIVLFLISGSPFPQNASKSVWMWMSLSGFVGFVIGDFFLFSSYRLIPARYTQLIMTLAPISAAFSAYLLLGEKLSPTSMLGIFVTITGIAISIVKRGGKKVEESVEISPPCAANYTIVTKPKILNTMRNLNHLNKNIHLELPIKGVLFAVCASIGQGLGLVLSKQGMLMYEGSLVESTIYIPLAATQIRIMTGIICFLIIIAFLRGYKDLFISFRHKKSIAASFGGAIVGPVIGVTLSLLAVQHTNTAVASTLMALSPIIILIPDRVIYKRRVHLIEVLGAIISVVGVSLFFI